MTLIPFWPTVIYRTFKFLQLSIKSRGFLSFPLFSAYPLKSVSSFPHSIKKLQNLTFKSLSEHSQTMTKICQITVPPRLHIPSLFLNPSIPPLPYRERPAIALLKNPFFCQLHTQRIYRNLPFIFLQNDNSIMALLYRDQSPLHPKERRTKKSLVPKHKQKKAKRRST